MLRPPRRHGKQQQPTQARHPSKQQQASQRSHGAVTSATKLTPIGLWPCLKAINLSSCCHRSGSNAVERKCSKQPRHQSKQRHARKGSHGAVTAFREGPGAASLSLLPVVVLVRAPLQVSSWARETRTGASRRSSKVTVSSDSHAVTSGIEIRQQWHARARNLFRCS